MEYSRERRQLTRRADPYLHFYMHSRRAQAGKTVEWEKSYLILSLSRSHKLFGLHDKMQYPLAAAQVHYKQAEGLNIRCS